MRSLAKDASTKVLLLHGDRDGVVPYPNSEALARMVPGVTLRRIEGAGHGDISRHPPYLDAVREAIDAAVRPGRSSSARAATGQPAVQPRD